MKSLRVEHDIQPVSAFRSNAAKLISSIQTHKRALVLTQHGRKGVSGRLIRVNEWAVESALIGQR